MSSVDVLRDRIARALGVDRNRVLFTWGAHPVHPIRVSLVEGAGSTPRALRDDETASMMAAGVVWTADGWKVSKGAT